MTLRLRVNRDESHCGNELYLTLPATELQLEMTKAKLGCEEFAEAEIASVDYPLPYRYCLRCNPVPGDYQAYLTCFDLDRQRLNLMNATRADIVGMTFYGDGNATSFTDADAYIKEIREELPYRATSGFRFETATDDPTVRKAVDDLVYNEFGENNPRPLEDYENTPNEGMTFGGM